ncbi:hypothetical protein FQR65_LT20093 [Abscondita terminalis]|nr:hypothetical protein FQR65_LT20093 [Abscondita terminalis]
MPYSGSRWPVRVVGVRPVMRRPAACAAAVSAAATTRGLVGVVPRKPAGLNKAEYAILRQPRLNPGDIHVTETRPAHSRCPVRWPRFAGSRSTSPDAHALSGATRARHRAASKPRGTPRAVPDLAARYRADRAEVRGRIPGHVKKWWLQDRSGEDDLVEAGVVVGVDRLRRHEPLITIDRFPHLADFTLKLELRDSTGIAHQVTRIDCERGIVAPLHRVADFGREPVPASRAARSAAFPAPFHVKLG